MLRQSEKEEKEPVGATEAAIEELKAKVNRLRMLLNTVDDKCEEKVDKLQERMIT